MRFNFLRYETQLKLKINKNIKDTDKKLYGRIS